MLRFCWNICILELWRGRLLRVRWRYAFLELWGCRVLRFRVRAGACMSMGMGAGMHACMGARVRAAHGMHWFFDTNIKKIRRALVF